MKYRDKLLAVFGTGGAYSLEQLTQRCTGSPDANRDVLLALERLRQDGVIEDIEGAFRLVRPSKPEQKGLF